jgi:hypothetical protein
MGLLIEKRRIRAPILNGHSIAVSIGLWKVHTVLLRRLSVVVIVTYDSAMCEAIGLACTEKFNHYYGMFQRTTDQ